jgi:hypothetical protein
VTKQELLEAADAARRLDDLLDRAIQSKTMPLLIGFDLDYLATCFQRAADGDYADE